jgi:hypothetical protein
MVKRVKRNTRKGTRASRRRQQGGWQALSPADVSDSSMQGPSQLSTAQGKEYDALHEGQHGGGAPLEGAPVGTTGVLDDSLRATARVTPLDQSVSAIQGMSDQSGGARRRSKRSKRSKSSKRSKRGSRRQGGGMRPMHPSDYSAPTHLLSSGAEAKALMQMNPEWKLAENPSSFAPKMSGGRRRGRGSRRKTRRGRGRK